MNLLRKTSTVLGELPEQRYQNRRQVAVFVLEHQFKTLGKKNQMMRGEWRDLGVRMMNPIGPKRLEREETYVKSSDVVHAPLRINKHQVEEAILMIN